MLFAYQDFGDVLAQASGSGHRPHYRTLLSIEDGVLLTSK